MIWSSRTMRLRISRFASTWITCASTRSVCWRSKNSKRWVHGMGETNLAGHDRVCRDVPDFANCAAIARPQLLDEVEMPGSQVEVVLDADLQLGGLVVSLASHVKGSEVVCRLGGRRRLRRRRGKSKALDILPLHGAGCKGIAHDVFVRRRRPEGRKARITGRRAVRASVYR